MDYLKRFLIALILGFCVSLLFLGGKHTETGMANINMNFHTLLHNSFPIPSQTHFFSV